MESLVGYDSDENSQNSSKHSPRRMEANQSDPLLKITEENLASEWDSFEKMLGGSAFMGASSNLPDKKELYDPEQGDQDYIQDKKNSDSSDSSSQSSESDSNGEDSPKVSQERTRSPSVTSPTMQQSTSPSKQRDKSKSTSPTRLPSTSKSPPARSKSPTRRRSRSRSHDRRRTSRSRDRKRRRSRSPRKRRRRSSERNASHKKKSGSRSRRSRSRSKGRKRSRSRSKRSRSRNRKSKHHDDRRRRKPRHKSPRRKRSRSRSRDRKRSRSRSRDRKRSRSRSRDRKRSRSRSQDRKRDRNISPRRNSRQFRNESPAPRRIDFKAKMRQELQRAAQEALEGKTIVKPTLKDLLESTANGTPLTFNSDGKITPQQALMQSMAAMHQKAQEITGVAVPKYYNPAAINPLKYAEQIQKRKLLWSKAKDHTEEKQAQWQVSQFSQDQEGKVASKFRKLMGIKGDGGEMTDASKMTEEQVKKQTELFQQLDRDYEFARMTTHTHRGVGLGMVSAQPMHQQQPQPPHPPQPQ